MNPRASDDLNPTTPNWFFRHPIWSLIGISCIIALAVNTVLKSPEQIEAESKTETECVAKCSPRGSRVFWSHCFCQMIGRRTE